MKKFKKAIVLVAVVAMVAAMFTGCGEEVYEKNTDKLTYWTGNSASKYVSAYDEAVAVQKIEEAVGVDIEFIHPSSSRWEEQFNIMIASGEYADIMHQANWETAYNGGVTAAYNDKVIIDLTPYYDGGKMPYYKKIVESSPRLINELKTVDGKIFTMGVIRDNPQMNASIGPQIRKDWLDKLNLSIPDTIGDWYNMLTAFKTQDPNGNGEADEIPLGDMSGQFYRHFSSAWGVFNGFYAKDGKVIYGPIQPEFKEYLAEMNKWYNEGLIDPEFAAITMANLHSKVTTHKVGAYIGYVGSNMNSYLTAMKDDPTFDITGAPWPRKDTNSIRHAARDISNIASGSGGCVVSSVCKDPETAIRVLDYFYSDNATELLNWGIEGTTFTKENGEYKFTDHVMKNPEGLAPADVLGDYIWPALGVPNKYWLNDSYSQLQFLYPQQREAVEKWVEGDPTYVSTHFKFTDEESERRSELQTDIEAYRDEMLTKMVIGKEPLSKFDEYVENMGRYGLEELTAIHQAGYDRYVSLGE